MVDGKGSLPVGRDTYSVWLTGSSRRTNTCWKSFASASLRMSAWLSNATWAPSALIEGRKPIADSPPGPREASSVTPWVNRRTYTAVVVPGSTPATRLLETEANASREPSALSDPDPEMLFPTAPVGVSAREPRIVVPELRSRTCTSSLRFVSSGTEFVARVTKAMRLPPNDGPKAAPFAAVFGVVLLCETSRVVSAVVSRTYTSAVPFASDPPMRLPDAVNAMRSPSLSIAGSVDAALARLPSACSDTKSRPDGVLT